MMSRIAKRGPLIQTLLVGVLIAAFFALALYLRVALRYNEVFGGGVVKFTGVDVYWHIRMVDNLVHNFPHFNCFDPYMLYPGGAGTNTLPFFDYLLAGIIWVIGLGSPSEHMADVISAYFPAILGALLVVPVYFIGKTLFNRWAGVVAAGLVAISPGDFLSRSALGFTDHHIAEMLLTTMAVLFLILALKNAKREPLTLASFRHPNWTSTTKPILYAVLAGIFLGTYLITWMGALLFVFIIAVYFVIQFVIDHMRRKATDYLCLVGAIAFLVALVIFVSVSRDRLYVAAITIAMLIPLALLGLSRLMSARGLRPVYYPMALVGLGLVGLGIFRALDYSMLKSMFDLLNIFAWHVGTTNSEMGPVLFRGDHLTASILWSTYGFSLLFAIAALGLVVYLLIKRGEAEKTLLIVWTVVIVAATLAQRRFNYYLAVNVAILAGYPAWQILRFAGLKEAPSEPDVKADLHVKKAKPKSRRKREGREFRLTATPLYVALVAIVLFSLFYFTTIDSARNTAKTTPFAPTDAWCESLTWLKDCTPEPFGDADFYYARYETPFDYSKYPDVYGVTSWWDYGYWIIRIGHRIPTLNPGGQSAIIPTVANLLLARDEASAVQISDKLGSRYVIVDDMMPLIHFDRSTGVIYGKFSPIASYTDHQDSEFFDMFWQKQTSGSTTSFMPVMLYFPEYYHSLSVRLYSFGGEEVIPQSCRVISYETQTQEGMDYKVIASDQTLSTYEDAVRFIQGKKNCLIVSDNPYSCPVPLEKLQHYQLVHDSGQSMSGLPEVRIFEYVK
jgi:dolichyl-diphosphooligosaccharide--protein glycosyltransferase